MQDNPRRPHLVTSLLIRRHPLSQSGSWSVASRRGAAAVIACAALGTLVATFIATSVARGHAATPRAQSVVLTESGLVRGSVGPHLREFLGIPYAAPPVGRLRWAPPSPPKWFGLREATRYPNNCPQPATEDPGLEQASLNEDCLGLNVVAPSTVGHERQLRTKRPVYVFIHGGGFVVGHAEFETMQDFVRKTGVIAVTLNYRLGVLGSLDVDGLDRSSAGVFSLLDQVAALKWVKRNIERFGGDPSEVTVGGQSAGAIAVCALMASPSARGLFERAIVQSGADCPMERTHAQAVADGSDFARKLGCVGAGNVVRCLRRKPVSDILAAQETLSGDFAPALGGPVLPSSPADAFASGRFNRVPVMIGANSQEFGSTFMQCGALDAAKLLSRTVPTYVYEFADETAPPLPGRPAEIAGSGAQHSAELQYLYMFNGYPSSLSPAQRSLGDDMIRYWSSFIDRGAPDGWRLTHWPPFREEDPRVIRFTPPVTSVTTDFAQRYGCP